MGAVGVIAPTVFEEGCYCAHVFLRKIPLMHRIYTHSLKFPRRTLVWQHIIAASDIMVLNTRDFSKQRQLQVRRAKGIFYSRCIRNHS